MADLHNDNHIGDVNWGENNGYDAGMEDGKIANRHSDKIIHSYEDKNTDDRFSNDNNDDGVNGDDEDDDENMNCCSSVVAKLQKGISDFVDANLAVIKLVIYIILLMSYLAYFSYAMKYEFGSDGSLRLLVCTIIGMLILARSLFGKYKQRVHKTDGMDEGNSCTDKLKAFLIKSKSLLILQVALVIGFIVFICVDVVPNEPRNLVSLCGMAVFVLSFYIFSYNPAKVKWRPVFWGLSIQLIFALMILRTSWGYDAFKWLGDRVTEFLVYTDAGSVFVFGDLYINHPFVFKVLPVVVYFSTVVSMLYYLGVMQVVIRLVGKFLSFCLGTSPTESINAAGNIFIGQTEAPLMIRPFLNDMTNSEIHAVMTGGFATIAGGVMALFISLNVPANHLISASVMSAPAALAMSKLFYPETKKTRINSEDVYKLAKGEERNLIEAASNGASMSISLVANIAVNLIAFVALLEFVNSTLVWFGDRVGYGELTFQNICSYVFWPIAFLMGVERDDCRTVAEMIGLKTFLNEVVAYNSLSVYINNRMELDDYITNATLNATGNWTGVWYEKDGGIYLQDIGKLLADGLISDRSVVIATYALCGFSNFSSMGIQLGALGVMAPNRKGDMSRLVLRA